jgi:uncharacterized protein with HEPN domain
MRAPEALLLDITLAAERLASYVNGMSPEQFLADDKTKAATVREIEIIGEACARLPAAYRVAHPEVPWSDLERLRNIYIHVYKRVRNDRVWATATRTIPAIAKAVERLVPKEPDDGHDS